MEPASVQQATIVLSDPGDPYYTLAEEIALAEQLPLAHSLDEALAQEPVVVLWVVSPAHLSDQAMVELGKEMARRSSGVSIGIISGSSLADARALWRRASEVEGGHLVAATASNPAGNIEAGITTIAGGERSVQSLTLANLIASLREADYLTFTGHGGSSYLALAEGMPLRAGSLPALPPVVVATGSCNTFRPWEDNSIALAFTDRGAAAYAGFVYSPNDGFLFAAYDGLPFRFTWPEFPIGHVVQVQNRGTLQGFAGIPYYLLLGDPRITMQVGPPYHLIAAQSSQSTMDLSYSDAPAGVIPVRVARGADYGFVEIPGVSAAWDQDPFYNSRLQMANLGGDKYVLFEHAGGDFSLHLRDRPPWLWLVGDVVLDALDHTLLFRQEGYGDLAMVVAGALALLPVALLLLRKKASPRMLPPAILIGLVFAVLYGLYALLRLEHLTITSKAVVFHPLGLLGTLLLVTCGAFLFLNARSWRGRLVAVLIAQIWTLVMVVFSLGVVLMFNAQFVQRLGVALWDQSLALQPLLALLLGSLVLGLSFVLLDAAVTSRRQGLEQPSLAESESAGPARLLAAG